MIPTIRFQILKYSRVNYVRLFWGQHHGQAAAQRAGGSTTRVVFANASQMRPYRGRGVLRLSEDGGRTWIASRTFNPAHYVYQRMTILPDGMLGLLWEREMQGLYFTRIPLEWIEAAKI